MANTLLTPDIIAKEALIHLQNNCIAGSLVHRQYKDEFVKVGDTVTIRKPIKFTVTTGAVASPQDVTEQNTSITIDQRRNISWQFSSQELTLEVEEYAERYMKGAMIKLANEIDAHVLQTAALGIHNHVGTPGTTPSSFSDLTEAPKRMDKLAVPDDGNRCGILDPEARWSLASGLGGQGSSGIFNPGMVKDLTRKGSLGELANVMYYGDQNLYVHTCGTQGGTPLLNDAAFTNDTNTITIDDATASVTNWARAGDVITIAGVNAVNPISFADTGELAQFVVLANANSDGAGNVDLTVYPSLNDGSTAATAAYQNVSALPADNAAISFSTGASAAQHVQNLVMHKNTVALVTCPLEMPDSAVWKARANWEGYSIRVVKGFDVTNDVEIIRLDVFWGSKVIYPELGVRLSG